MTGAAHGHSRRSGAAEPGTTTPETLRRLPPGPEARLTLAWVDAIGQDLSLPVTLRDERLSSHLAETRLGSMKRGRSGGPPTRAQRGDYRARVDREAAAIILQDELDARAGPRS